MKAHHSTLVLLARLLGVALVYFWSARAGLTYAVVGHTVTLVWPPSGLALVAVLLYGPRMGVGIALGAFLVNAWTGLPLGIAAGIAVGNTLEALVGAALLTRWAGFQADLARRRDVFALVFLAAMASTLVGAFIGTSSLLASHVITPAAYASSLTKWWLGDMMGVLVVAPPILVVFTHTLPRLAWRQALEAAVLLAALLAVGYAIFAAPELAGHGYYPAALAVFPFVIWGALRFDHWGASLVTLVAAMLAIWGTFQGIGPFAVDSPVDSLVRWCTFVNVLAVTGLLLAASRVEQGRSQAELQRSHDALEQRVLDRTRALLLLNTELQQEMAERRRLEATLIRLSEDQQKTIGRELHDGLGQHLTSIALLGASLQQRLVATPAEAQAAHRLVTLVNQAIAMTRAICRGLYPAELESAGLIFALQQLVESTNPAQRIQCTFHADHHIGAIDPLTSINLYRIAQEIINNALKHSQCQHVHLAFEKSNDNLILSISDDGIGIDKQLTHPHRGLGIHNVRYRACLLGGKFSIEKNTPQGTCVTVTCPAG